MHTEKRPERAGHTVWPHVFRDSECEQCAERRESDAEYNPSSSRAHLPEETGALQVSAEFWAGLSGLGLSDPEL